MIDQQTQAALAQAESYMRSENKEYLLRSGDRNDIVAVAEDLHFKIILVELNDSDGYVVINDTEKIPRYDCNRLIAVNSEKSLKSKRYIIAWEISEYFKRKSESKGKPQRYTREIEVDDERVDEEEVNRVVALLAARLLMPETMMITMLDKMKGKPADWEKTVAKLSDYFKVPYTLAAERVRMMAPPTGERTL
ncbi:MAG: ImmA/IrrE family metallo-endopeptidase [Firmicutes bacterium]|nr:ImmA/IrrE family metallo-endopeptidase [Bacillota bacterium]